MRGPRWTRSETEKLRKLKARGLAPAQIAWHMIGRTVNAINSRIAALGLGAQTVTDKSARRVTPISSPMAEAKNGARVRPCMSCRRPFPSEGPHNRLCGNCRHTSVSPFEP